jgi:hypothetical protein
MNMTKRKPEPIEEDVPRRKHEHHDKVTASLLGSLGIPPGFQKIKAINVYENNWRVDVYTKAQIEIECIVSRMEISDSFFIRVDENGKILTPISKKYENGIASVPSV